ncbi:ROK family protein [Deinococcus cavernae]|uniref:ROK family protein n=1 Tax=Deinococcus cavernae TaxID=2320857 RepID=A0A418V945_9DEIO|nr:ROK family protein [Deinococcus cavernae]RJF72638.1 ROK family protein [Deinococcus cavernae]
MTVILGIDIGGSGIKGAPVDTATGQLLAERWRIPTPEGAKPADVTRVVKELVEHFQHGGPVGITFPGIVQHGVTLSAANVDQGWIGLDADRLFTDATGCDVHLINDADAAGLAEAKFGAGVGVPGVVMVLTFGTGIGSALINDGVLVPNTELGHLWLRDKHAESWASDRARENDDLNWKQWSKRAVTYLQHLELLFSPDLFIIGGGISKKADRWRDLVTLERSQVVPAALLNDAGIVGAALYAELEAGREKPPRPASVKAQHVEQSATRKTGTKKADPVKKATKAPAKKSK